MAEPGPTPQVVIDTNVLVAALRSSRGASARFMSLFGKQAYATHISVPLALEYEEVLLRHADASGYAAEDVRQFVSDFCAASQQHLIYYLWRHELPDPRDAYVIELAVKANADYIISYNKRDLLPSSQSFGVRVVTAKEFLDIIG